MAKQFFGFWYFKSYEKNGITHFKWRLKWWYAVWLILKMTFNMLFDRNVYAEHNSEPGPEWMYRQEEPPKPEENKSEESKKE